MDDRPTRRTEHEGASWLARMELAYADHADSLLRLAYCLVGTQADAEDLVHDTFVRVFSKVRTPATSSELRSYLHKSLINAARTRWRRRRYEPPLVEETPDRELPGADVDERDAMWAQLRKLPQRQRAVVYFRYYEHLSEMEMAERLDCSVPAVRSLAHRAVKTLRQEMDR